MKFLADFFPTVRLFVFVFEILTIKVNCKRTHTAQLCSMLAMFKANEHCYKRTFGLYGFECDKGHYRSELKILWDILRSQIAELWFPYDRWIANYHRWSQTIVEDRTWFYLLRSSAITNFLRFAIVCDHMETSLYSARKFTCHVMHRVHAICAKY